MDPSKTTMFTVSADVRISTESRFRPLKDFNILLYYFTLLLTIEDSLSMKLCFIQSGSEEEQGGSTDTNNFEDK